MTKDAITSLQNPLVKHFVKLRLQARYRYQQRQVVLSSRKLIHELSQHVKPIEILGQGGCPVSESVLKKITGHPSPEGIVATFPLPKSVILKTQAPILVLDQIGDPGNMGTLLRSAWAFGWKGVFILPGSVDPFHEKVLSASRGALFHISWQAGDWEELEHLSQTQNLTAYVADMKGKPLTSISTEKQVLLLLSSEAQGVSKYAETFGTKLAIPMEPQAESLNVAIAGAVMMHHLCPYE